MTKHDLMRVMGALNDLGTRVMHILLNPAPDVHVQEAKVRETLRIFVGKLPTSILTPLTDICQHRTTELRSPVQNQIREFMRDNPGLRDRIIGLLEGNRKIQAIKLVRESTGFKVGLKEAKDYVDSLSLAL